MITDNEFAMEVARYTIIFSLSLVSLGVRVISSFFFLFRIGFSKGFVILVGV